MIRTPRFSQGSRVEVTRGRLPANPEHLGRTGLVLQTDSYRPGRYGVVLDGDDETLEFLEDELLPADAGGS